VRIPEGVDAGKVIKHMMSAHRIEIASSFARLSGKVFRIGLMGMNSEKSTVDYFFPKF
jgi:alanine-glyoxylate transaminase/serine-glyoxylate transaminase/serine-pyruvate transaminase